MRILVGSYAFAPRIGGTETVTLLLARRWAGWGHDVTVVTDTPAEGPDEFPYRVIRRPGAREMGGLLRRADVYWQNNASLRLLWPWPLVRPPIVVTHQTWLTPSGAPPSCSLAAKRLFIRCVRNCAISAAIAARLGEPAVVIGNPYDDGLFSPGTGRAGEGGAAPGRDFLFVGRLVSDKGVDLYVRALAELRRRGHGFTATIVGDGTERPAMEALVAELGLGDAIRFAGPLTGPALVECYRAHRLLVVPSRWEEPFGIVALEGIACGCVVIGSNGGGLPEAIGPCGFLFQSGSVESLVDACLPALGGGQALLGPRAAAPAHLAGFSADAVARRYLELFTSAAGSGGRSVHP